MSTPASVDDTEILGQPITLRLPERVEKKFRAEAKKERRKLAEWLRLWIVDKLE